MVPRPWASASVVLTGAVNGGGAITQQFALNGAVLPFDGAKNFFPTVFDSVAMGPIWSGVLLDSVVFQGVGPDGTVCTNDDTENNFIGCYYAIDNIVVNEAPEPSSLAIFGFATAVLGWTVRRRKAVPAT